MKTILVDAIGGLVTKDEGLYKPMVDMLDTFPNKKIILTGANNKEIKKFGLTYLPYELFTLQHDPDKIDPTYYKQMLEHYKLKSHDVIYAEHNPEAAKSAESVGIKTFFYDENKKDIEGLKQFITDNI
jgi:FMN phosphatase YigB (HAD superfamily)